MTKISIRRLRFVFVGLMTLTSLATWTLPNLVAVAQSSGESANAWRLVRTPNPRGGPEAVSIMRTADTTRSDLDFAGLMVRCSQEGSELAIVLLNAFPLQTRPRVTFGKPGHETHFEATIGAPGNAVVLKGDPKSILGEAWSAEGDLFVRVTDDRKSVSGVVTLGGIQPAFALLKANCPTP